MSLMRRSTVPRNVLVNVPSSSTPFHPALYRIGDGGYRGPNLAELVPETLYSVDATHTHRNADGNRVDVLATPFETGAQRAADR